MNARKLQMVERWLAKAVGGLVISVAALGGAGLVSYGAWLAWRPSGFIVAGSLLIAGVWLHDRTSG